MVIKEKSKYTYLIRLTYQIRQVAVNNAAPTTERLILPKLCFISNIIVIIVSNNNGNDKYYY